MRRPWLLLLCVATVTGCERATIDPVDQALRRVTTALESGQIRASTLLNDTRFVTLKEDPATRSAIRELVRTNATESDVLMIADAEPGERLTLRIRIEDERTDALCPDAVVSVVQVDATGYYRPFGEVGTWNPRLFATALTGDDGAVIFRTIRPVHYGPAYDADDKPAHVHFDIRVEGYRPYDSEIWFEGDPRITVELKGRSPTATLRRATDGTWDAEVSIPVQPIG